MRRLCADLLDQIPSNCCTTISTVLGKCKVSGFAEKEEVMYRVFRKEAPWARYFMVAPKRRNSPVERYKKEQIAINLNRKKGFSSVAKAGLHQEFKIRNQMTIENICDTSEAGN